MIASDLLCERFRWRYGAASGTTAHVTTAHVTTELVTTAHATAVER